MIITRGIFKSGFRWQGLAWAILLGVPLADSAGTVSPPDRAQLVAEFDAAFARKDWRIAARAAGDLLGLEESLRSAGDPALVPLLLNVASAEAELRNTERAEVHLRRATLLLDAQPTPDPALRFDRDIVLARVQYQQGRFQEAQLVCRRALRAGKANPAVGTARRFGAYVLLLDTAKAMSDFAVGNMAARDLVDEEQAALGKASPERRAGLYAAATWYRTTSQMPREREKLAEAVAIIDKAYGPDDLRLAYPLLNIGMSYLVGHDKPEASRTALERAAQLPTGPEPADVVLRAQILAGLGDHAVVFDDEPQVGAAHYMAAWRAVADDPRLGTLAANQMFLAPRPLYVSIPDEPFRGLKGSEHFARGDLTFAFTVTEGGHVEALRIKEREMGIESLPMPATKAFRGARYRPRVHNGKPVATADQEFRLRFRFDPKSGY